MVPSPHAGAGVEVKPGDPANAVRGNAECRTAPAWAWKPPGCTPALPSPDMDRTEELLSLIFAKAASAESARNLAEAFVEPVLPGGLDSCRKCVIKHFLVAPCWGRASTGKARALWKMIFSS